MDISTPDIGRTYTSSQCPGWRASVSVRRRIDNGRKSFEMNVQGEGQHTGRVTNLVREVPMWWLKFFSDLEAIVLRAAVTILLLIGLWEIFKHLWSLL
jgi:hypothetical protein